MPKPLKPGTTADRSGQYERVTPSGRGTGAEVTVTKGKTLPPTPHKGEGYTLVDPTNNASGKPKK